MRLLEKRENYYVESKTKLYGTTRWTGYSPLDAKETVEECEALIKDFIKQSKEQGDLSLWKFRIIKRVEKHYAVKIVVGD